MTRPKSPRQREREAVMTAWLLEQAAKKKLPRTRIAGDAPLWIRAVVTREGDDLVTKCCIVADADVHPFEVRVNMRHLASAVRKMMAEGKLPAGLAADKVGGFGSFLGKVGRAITHNKVTKAVGKVVKKVVSNPIVQIANPMAAITAHTIIKAATGSGVIRGPAGKLVDLGAAVAAPAGLAHVTPQAIGALGLGAKTIMATKMAGTISAVAKDAQRAVALGNQAAAALKTGKITAAVAKPLVQRALAVKATVSKVAPALSTKAKISKDVKKSLVSIAAKARAGNPDARYTAAVIARTAKMSDEIGRLQQAAGGGNAGFVITATGKIKKAPKGKFVQRASVPVFETLYRGASTIPLRGVFTAVSGADYPGGPLDRGQSWGGEDDPGDDYEGPFLPVHGPAIEGCPARGWKGAPGTTAAARDRTKALLELARARHHLKSAQKRARKIRTTKVGNMSHYDLPHEMTEQSDGIPRGAQIPEIIGCGPAPAVGADIMISGLPWYVFTQRNLQMPTIRRRFLAGLKAMPPKMRRRVVGRLRNLHLRARISGAIRGVNPTVGYSLQGLGWAGVHGWNDGVGSHGGAASWLTP